MIHEGKDTLLPQAYDENASLLNTLSASSKVPYDLTWQNSSHEDNTLSHVFCPFSRWRRQRLTDGASDASNDPSGSLLKDLPSSHHHHHLHLRLYI